MTVNSLLRPLWNSPWDFTIYRKYLYNFEFPCGTSDARVHVQVTEHEEFFSKTAWLIDL